MARSLGEKMGSLNEQNPFSQPTFSVEINSAGQQIVSLNKKTFVCMYLCMYVYIYIYIYTHTHTQSGTPLLGINYFVTNTVSHVSPGCGKTEKDGFLSLS
jgi:hypothetical protein